MQSTETKVNACRFGYNLMRLSSCSAKGTTTVTLTLVASSNCKTFPQTVVSGSTSDFGRTRLLPFEIITESTCINFHFFRLQLIVT